MRILVTGANGQLGSELKNYAKIDEDLEFIFTDIDSLDLTNFKDTQDFIISKQPDYVINCAAYTAVDKAEKEKDLAELLNARVPQEIAKICNETNIRLVQISTDYVFDGETCIPLNEDNDTNPPSVYGKSKLMGEKAILKEGDAIIIRTSWLYSKYGHNFVKSMLKYGEEREELKVVFDQIGTPTSAADLAQAIISVVKYSDSTNSWESGIYHYSNEGVCSWYDFANEILKNAGIKCKVTPIESHEYKVDAPRPFYSVMNKKKIKNTFNISIPHWSESLKHVVSDIINQE